MDAAGKKDLPVDIEISDDDIYVAMKDIEGYLDITPADLKDLYRKAYRHAYERIIKSVRARDIMTREVVAIRRTTAVDEVADIMANRGISGVPVLDDEGKIAGIISGKDFLVNMGAKERLNFMSVVSDSLKGEGCITSQILGKKAEDIMSSPAITVTEDTSLTEIACIFSENNINRVPVTDKSGALIGIVSRADIVRASTVRTGK